MIKGIPKEQHGLLDLTYVPLVLAAPKLVGFQEEEMATKFCYVMSGTVVVYSLLTDASWGAVKLIPYKAHAAIDLSAGLLCLAAPAVLKVQNNKRARNTLLAMGIVSVIVGTLSLIGASRSGS